MNKWNGHEYNKRDFHYARTSQEAFGRRLSKDDFAETNAKWDIVVGVVSLIIAVCVILLEWRMG